MKKLFLFLFTSSISLLLNAQNDPQAKAILDKVAANNKAHKTIRTNFTVSGSNTQNNEKSSQKGTLLIKNDKYMLKMPDNEIYFDGKDVYTFLPESKEVNITKPQNTGKSGDDFFISNPRDIFKIYQKDFKNKFIKESSLNGKSIYEIDLYPVDLKKKYSRIRIQIDKNSSNIISLKAFFKDGIQYLVTFDNFEVNKDLPDNLFVFDKSKYPGVEVVDLRF